MSKSIIDKIIFDFMNLKIVQAGKGVFQNEFHEFDVYEHTGMFVKHIIDILGDNPSPELIVAGILHDVGKPIVASPKKRNGIIQERSPGKPYYEFHNHELVGETMVLNIPSKLFDKYKINKMKISKLVGAHYLPMKGIKSLRAAENFKNFILAYKELNNTLDQTGLSKEEIMVMFLADKLAQGKFCTDKDELFAIRDLILSKKEGDLEKIYTMQKDKYGNKK